MFLNNMCVFIDTAICITIVIQSITTTATTITTPSAPVRKRRGGQRRRWRGARFDKQKEKEHPKKGHTSI